MRIIRFKPQIVAIPESDPFQNDLLGRKPSAEVLTDFVSSQEEPFVLAINSTWGSGKTTFLRMWEQHLKLNGIKCLRYNAWENDFSESPLISLIGELSESLKAMRAANEVDQDAERYLQKTKDLGAALFKAALPTAVKIATAGIVDSEDLAKLTENIAKKQIESYGEEKKSMDGFKKELKNLVKSLSKNESVHPPKPVVFIIDELDRCRPTYAIELLENIKHLFCVDGLVFVIAIDRDQFNESVKTLYGIGTNTDGYLRRFIDLEYRLPEPNIQKFAEAQFARFELTDAIELKTGSAKEDINKLIQSLPALFSIFNFSLRIQEQCFTQVAIALRTTPYNNLLYGRMLAFLICLRATNQHLYYAYCRKEIAADDILQLLKKNQKGKDFLLTREGIELESYLTILIADEDERNRLFKKYNEPPQNMARLGYSGNPNPRLSILVFISNQGFDILDFLFKKIELLHRFADLNPN